ncbi:MAG: RnfABCDGE type electron transport complex subunit [Clostridiaceae bacterium]|jgi:RnfABCDGE-type electron transport complex B subunit|nr:RnfABCDGE type electron transport complex subunit [Clostridiaceae bacterium]
MNTAIMVIIVMGMVGTFFGLVLAIGNRKFAIEVNPLIELVEDELPKGQCGACGFAGCKAYAEAVVMNKDVPPNLCVPGKEQVAKKVSELTGKTAEKVAPKVAQVRCAGSKCKSIKNYNYVGVQDCTAASLLLGGPKECSHGCLGFGTCVKNCPFGALTMSEDGLPVVDLDICTGCGKCESVCPKKVINIIPKESMVRVNCNSKDKGAVVRKICSAGCIGCGICSRSCSYNAIKIENNLAVVDSNICIEKCDNPTCLVKCPTGAIRPVVSGVVPGTEEKDEKHIATKVS